MLKIRASIARQAIAIKNSALAELLADIAEGACVHGNFDHGYDMEQACLACEFGEGESDTVGEVAYLRAKRFLIEERRREALKVCRWALTRFECSDAQALAIIMNVVDEWRGQY
jgi:hypothetical protein